MGRRQRGRFGSRRTQDGDQPEDEQEQQNQQHTEELPNRMPLPWSPRKLRRRGPAGSSRTAGWSGRQVPGEAVRFGWGGSGSTRGEYGAAGGRARHHASAFRLRLLAVASVQPVEILVAPGRHVSKGTWRCSHLFLLLSAPDPARRRAFSAEPQAPNILAGIFPQIPSPADRKASKVSVRTADVAPRAPTSFPTCFERSERIKRRRGLTFLAMTLVLPGSAQLAGGSRRIGMFALRVWASLWLLALLAGWRSSSRRPHWPRSRWLPRSLHSRSGLSFSVWDGLCSSWMPGGLQTLASKAAGDGLFSWPHLDGSPHRIWRLYRGCIHGSAQHELTTAVFSGGGTKSRNTAATTSCCWAVTLASIASDSGRTASLWQVSMPRAAGRC